ncbi:restriction endonuclease subunit S [Ruegeria arenilitoris]|uniref:restriction endonuclease subunit S n=1 Tax=Ruegeria arenilitoris TaxID=1173585 RepID=UPI00147DC2EB|nr:restriction endonuclease subunit S [Ruegeria arenilitoris]
MSELRQPEKLGEICYIKARIGWRGLSSSEYTDDGPYLIAGQHIRNGQIAWDKCDHISEQRYLESHEIILRSGDVIITKDGTIGRVARVDELPGDATINGTMMLIRPLRRLDYRYLYHVLNGRGFQKLIDDKVSGSSIPHLFQRDMVELKVDLPTPPHQSKIAEVLDTLDAAIRGTEAVVAKLKAMKQGLLHDLLTRGIDANGDLRPPHIEAPHLYKETPLGWLPKEWEVAQLGTISSKVTDGTHQAVRTVDFEDGTHPFLFVSCVREGQIKWKSAARVDEKHYKEISKGREPEVGMILYTAVGSYGHAAMVDADIQFAFQRHIACIFPIKRLVEPGFLAEFLNSASARKHADRVAIGNAQKTVTLGELSRFPVPVPNNEEQLQISKRLASSNEACTNELTLLDKLRLQKSGLMDDLLTGRVSVAPLLEEGAAHGA